MSSSKAWFIVPGVFVPLWVSFCLLGKLAWYDVVIGSVLITAVAAVGWK